MDRNRQKRKGCNSGLSVSPRRKNSETAVLFRSSMLLMMLMEKTKVEATKSVAVQRC
jgi:hypothetical protein